MEVEAETEAKAVAPQPSFLALHTQQPTLSGCQPQVRQRAFAFGSTIRVELVAKEEARDVWVCASVWAEQVIVDKPFGKRLIVDRVVGCSGVE